MWIIRYDWSVTEADTPACVFAVKYVGTYASSGASKDTFIIFLRYNYTNTHMHVSVDVLLWVKYNLRSNFSQPLRARYFISICETAPIVVFRMGWFKYKGIVTGYRLCSMRSPRMYSGMKMLSFCWNVGRCERISHKVMRGWDIHSKRNTLCPIDEKDRKKSKWDARRERIEGVSKGSPGDGDYLQLEIQRPRRKIVAYSLP